MSKPDISKSFSYPIYGYSLKVTLTENVGELARKLYPELPPDQTGTNVGGIHVQCGRSHIILPHDAEIGVIVHEVYHFVWWLMEVIGALHDNEIIAYHMGYTVQRICEWLVKIDTKPVDKPVEAVEKMVDKVARL